jgi:hypothetical protein
MLEHQFLFVEFKCEYEFCLILLKKCENLFLSPPSLSLCCCAAHRVKSGEPPGTFQLSLPGAPPLRSPVSAQRRLNHCQVGPSGHPHLAPCLGWTRGLTPTLPSAPGLGLARLGFLPVPIKAAASRRAASSLKTPNPRAPLVAAKP